jgi:hypothetical protein
MPDKVPTSTPLRFSARPAACDRALGCSPLRPIVPRCPTQGNFLLFIVEADA